MNQRLKTLLRARLPRSVGRQHILAGPLRGQRIVTSWHDYPGAILGRTERPLLKWFAQNVALGETWLDIGAHYGYTALALCRLVGYTGRVFAFEPMLSTAGYLTQTRLLNNLAQLTILPLALAAPTDFALAHLPTTRGMLDRTLTQTDPQTRIAWKENFLVARFDWLWPLICAGQPQVHGIKLDVQGMELEVLQGMAETLRQYQPKLVIEVHIGVNRAELLSLVKMLGYSTEATPIEPSAGEIAAQYLDDRSYAFLAEVTL